MTATTSDQTEEFDATELGAMMREMRENLGHDLEKVAADLRIRLVYLEAIENGRLGDLPGSAYVSGFLRAYSDYLGLDGEEIVRRFKMAGADISNKTQLHLPSPVEEGRLPTAMVLLVAAVIAAGAYGGWYYVSSQDGDPMETVAKLPSELSGLVEGAANQTSPAPAQAQPEIPAAAPETTPAAEMPNSESALAVPAAPAQPAVETASAPKPEPAEEPAPVQPPEPASEPPVAASEPTTQTAAAAREPVQPVSRILPGESSDVVRIVVRATADSYVAVRTSNNEPLFSHLMRPGDSYEVPSGIDLMLETGNAGGLQITVGGKKLPPLGPTGQVRRNIPLDAERLLSGVN